MPTIPLSSSNLTLSESAYNSAFVTDTTCHELIFNQHTIYPSTPKAPHSLGPVIQIFPVASVRSLYLWRGLPKGCPHSVTRLMSSYDIDMYSTEMAPPIHAGSLPCSFGNDYGHTCAMSRPEYRCRMHTPILKAYESPHASTLGHRFARVGQHLILGLSHVFSHKENGSEGPMFDIEQASTDVGTYNVRYRDTCRP
uniref:Uncharacterized protein n=1 Tax=Solanum tuberosum TaxID=4113 RepID=M1DL92_SOLTU